MCPNNLWAKHPLGAAFVERKKTARSHGCANGPVLSVVMGQSPKTLMRLAVDLYPVGRPVQCGLKCL